MPTEFKSIEEVLDFAIANEDKAHDFYIELARRAKSPVMQHVFEGFAAEEFGHKLKLQAVKDSEFQLDPEDDIPSLGVAESAEDVEPSDQMSYADALVLAMKREKEAYRLYLDLAAAAPTQELTDLFLGLANEEAKHKLRFELEYDKESI
jgi:rubrerythrin